MPPPALGYPPAFGRWGQRWGRPAGVGALVILAAAAAAAAVALLGGIISAGGGAGGRRGQQPPASTPPPSTATPNPPPIVPLALTDKGPSGLEPVPVQTPPAPLSVPGSGSNSGSDGLPSKAPPAARADGGNDADRPDVCWPQDADELTDAVEQQTCPVVLLGNAARDAYALARPINVTRAVRVVGDPGALPRIDGGETERCFTVLAGGFLELQFLRLAQGMGVYRPRARRRRQAQQGGMDEAGQGEGGEQEEEEEDAEEPPGGVVEIRGGGVAVEAGAQGARFVGVVFLAVQNTPESVAAAVEATARGVGARVWGGHVFVAAGRVDFIGCHFWDTAIFTPLTDQLIFGGDVLVAWGEARFDGCSFTQTTVFGSALAVGAMVAVFGGNCYFDFCVAQSQGVGTSIHGVGQSMFLGGGCMIMNGFDIRTLTVAYFSSGAADCFVGGGVLVYGCAKPESYQNLLQAINQKQNRIGSPPCKVM